MYLKVPINKKSTLASTDGNIFIRFNNYFDAMHNKLLDTCIYFMKKEQIK